MDYLTTKEREKLEEVAKQAEDRRCYSVCLVLLWTGCSVEELTTMIRADLLPEGFIQIRDKESKEVTRKVPVPEEKLKEILRVHVKIKMNEKLWEWTNRGSFETRVKELLNKAEIPHKLKAIYNSYGVYMAQQGYPLDFIATSIGISKHSAIDLYGDSLKEEKLYERLFETFKKDQEIARLKKENDALAGRVISPEHALFLREALAEVSKNDEARTIKELENLIILIDQVSEMNINKKNSKFQRNRNEFKKLYEEAQEGLNFSELKERSDKLFIDFVTLASRRDPITYNLVYQCWENSGTQNLDRMPKPQLLNRKARRKNKQPSFPSLPVPPPPPPPPLPSSPDLLVAEMLSKLKTAQARIKTLEAKLKARNEV